MHQLNETSVEPTESAALRYRSPVGTFELRAYGAQVVRIRLESGADHEAVRYAGGELLSRADQSPATLGANVLKTDEARVRVTPEPFSIELNAADGRRLISELSFAFAQIDQARDSGAGARFQVRFRLPNRHHYYGLGHGGQGFDRVGGERQLWNSHVGHGPGSDMGMPLLVSNHGYALLFDNTYDARISTGRNEDETMVFFDAEGGPVDLYLICTANVRAALAAVADLVGRALMPPKWALGFLQSTRHFNDTDELRRLGATLREKRIPTDGLIFLSTYTEALGWNRQVGHLEFEPTLWDDPKRIIDEMHERHFRVITHEYPVLHPEAESFKEATEKGYLLAEGYESKDKAEKRPAAFHEAQQYIDFSHPEARRWWWKEHQQLLDLGVAGWWLDGGEGPPAKSRLHEGSGTALHNAYDLLRYRAFAEGEAESRPDLRPMLVCRSGAIGMQRYGAGCWSGDIDNTFKTLAAQVPLGLNTAMSGVPYWGTDIGGFFQPTVETGELFTRWFQFGAFCPLFRAHGWVWRDHLPWSQGDEVEAICRRYAELRYALMPYTYSLASQATRTGLPLMRPLVLNYPDDPRVWDMGDEYLWGDDLLVAPVVREGARRWAVYLPEGRWYDFWTHERYAGGAAVEVEAPLDRLPLFVREGAIIPTTTPVQYSGERPQTEIELLVYPGGEGRFELYEDDGLTNGYKNGAYAVSEIRCTTNEGMVHLEIGRPTGEASVVPRGRTYAARIRVARPKRVASGGAELPELPATNRGGRGWWYAEGFAHVQLGEGEREIRIS